jgi:hypothetical protein
VLDMKCLQNSNFVNICTYICKVMNSYIEILIRLILCVTLGSESFHINRCIRTNVMKLIFSVT